MFTGIVDHTGIISEVKLSERGVTLSIESQFSDFSSGCRDRNEK
jgi:riboflavin synthase alpha subunit